MVKAACLLSLLLLTACAVPIPEASLPPPSEPASIAAPPEEQGSEPVQTSSADPARPDAPKPKARHSAPVPASAPPPPPPPADLDRQPIEELVIRPDNVTGFWRLTAARTIDVDIGIFSGVHIRYGGEVRDRNICWFEQKGRSFDAACASGGALRTAEGSVNDEGLSMRFWVGAATINFSGKFTDAERVQGGFSGGVAGLSLTGDVPATLTKLPTPAPDAEERPSAALIRMVWEDVRKGALTEGRYEGAAVKRVNQGMSKEIAAETPQQLSYLGQILTRWRKEQRELLQDVYLVQTSVGRRMCRVSANAQGQVVDFSCLTL